MIKENKSKLKSLFPETDKDGEIDVVSLLSLLGVDNEEQNECFGLNWAGKRSKNSAKTNYGNITSCKN